MTLILVGIIDHAQNPSEKWMMEMISEKIYGTSKEILEPEEQKSTHEYEPNMRLFP